MMRRQEPKRIAGQVKETLPPLVAPEPWATWAWQRRCIPRASSKLTGTAFCALMTTDLLDNPAGSYGGRCELLQPRHPPATMPHQALQQRLHTPEAVADGPAVLPLALRAPRTPLSAQMPAAFRASCRRVCLADRTPGCRPEKVAEALTGAGGRASHAAVPSDGISALRSHHLHALPVTDGRAADQGPATAIVPCLRTGELVLRD
jgi:hypothetical protein